MCQATSPMKSSSWPFSSRTYTSWLPGVWPGARISTTPGASA